MAFPELFYVLIVKRRQIERFKKWLRVSIKTEKLFFLSSNLLKSMSLKGHPLLYPGLVLYPHPHPTSAVILRTLNNGPATPLIGLYYKIITYMKCMFFQ